MAEEKITLIVTDDPEAKLEIPIRKGINIRVVEVNFATPDLNPASMKALLCGYDPGTCAAVIDVSE